jgi:hypothetical protein
MPVWPWRSPGSFIRPPTVRRVRGGKVSSGASAWQRRLCGTFRLSPVKDRSCVSTLTCSAPRSRNSGRLTHRCTCHAAVRWTGAEAPMLRSARRRHGSCRSLLPTQLLGAATAAPRRFVVREAGVQVNDGSVRLVSSCRDESANSQWRSAGGKSGASRQHAKGDTVYLTSPGVIGAPRWAHPLKRRRTSRLDGAP